MLTGCHRADAEASVWRWAWMQLDKSFNSLDRMIEDRTAFRVDIANWTFGKADAESRSIAKDALSPLPFGGGRNAVMKKLNDESAVDRFMNHPDVQELIEMSHALMGTCIGYHNPKELCIM